MRLDLIRSCPLKAGDIPTKRGHRWHCSQCDKHVVDVTQMGPERAATLIRDKAHRGERVCAQWVADRHGNVIFDVARAAAAAGALAFAGSALADGNDVPIDVVALLQQRQANNEANQHAESASTASGSEIIEDTGLMMMMGDVEYIPPPTPPAPPSKP